MTEPTRPIEAVEPPESEEEDEPEEVVIDSDDEDCCTACLEYMHERKNPPSCQHYYCVVCFHLLIARRTNCLICDVPIYEITRVFKDLKSRENIAANQRRQN